MIKKGSKGMEVSTLQHQLVKLGFDLTPDGAFGGQTDAAVRQLQTLFGYTVDGIVGPGTQNLIEQQIGYGWNAKAPDAAQKALNSQHAPTASQNAPAASLQPTATSQQKPVDSQQKR